MTGQELKDLVASLAVKSDRLTAAQTKTDEQLIKTDAQLAKTDAKLDRLHDTVSPILPCHDTVWLSDDRVANAEPPSMISEIFAPVPPISALPVQQSRMASRTAAVKIAL